MFLELELLLLGVLVEEVVDSGEGFFWFNDVVVVFGVFFVFWIGAAFVSFSSVRIVVSIDAPSFGDKGDFVVGYALGTSFSAFVFAELFGFLGSQLGGDDDRK